MSSRCRRLNTNREPLLLDNREDVEMHELEIGDVNSADRLTFIRLVTFHLKGTYPINFRPTHRRSELICPLLLKVVCSEVTTEMYVYVCRRCKKYYITARALRKHKKVHRNRTKPGGSEQDGGHHHDGDDRVLKLPEPNFANAEVAEDYASVQVANPPTNVPGGEKGVEERNLGNEHNETKSFVGSIPDEIVISPPSEEVSECHIHSELLQTSAAVKDTFLDGNEEDSANQACTSGSTTEEGSVSVNGMRSCQAFSSELSLEVDPSVTSDKGTCEEPDKEIEERLASANSEIEIDETLAPWGFLEHRNCDDESRSTESESNPQDPLDIDIDENDINTNNIAATSGSQSAQAIFQISPSVIDETSRTIVTQLGHVSSGTGESVVDQRDDHNLEATVNPLVPTTDGNQTPTMVSTSSSSSNIVNGPDNNYIAVLNELNINNTIFEETTNTSSHKASGFNLKAPPSVDYSPNRRRHYDEVGTPSPITNSDEPASKRRRSLSTDDLVIEARENNYTAGFLDDDSMNPDEIVRAPSYSLRQRAIPDLLEKTTTESSPENESNNVGNVLDNLEANSSTTASPMRSASASPKDVELDIIKVIPPKQKKKSLTISSWITKGKKRSFRNGGRQGKKCSFCDVMVDGEDPTVNKTIRIGRTEVPLSCCTCKAKYGQYRILLKRYMKDTKYGCSVCRKDFNTKTGLISHFHVHTGEKRVVVKREPQPEPEGQNGEEHNPPDIFSAVKTEQENGMAGVEIINGSAAGHNGLPKKRRGPKASTSPGASSDQIERAGAHGLRKLNEKVCYRV